MAKTMFIGQWVWIYLTGQDHAEKVQIKKLIQEGGSDAYLVVHEDQTKEAIWVSSVHRIIPVHPKKGRLINFEKRRQKLKLVK